MLTAILPGTGGTQPLPDRALACLCLTVGGTTLLVDCGEGTQTALRRWGISAYRISHILLTHCHGDHILGLPGLLQTLASLGRTAPLGLIGPPGWEILTGLLLSLAGPLPFAVQCQTADAAPFAAGGFTVTPIRLEHRVPCRGYRFDLPRAGRFDPDRARAAGIPVDLWRRLQAGETVDGFTPDQVLGPPRRGLSVVYATDTSPCPALEEAARGVDLLCMDATYADDADEEKARLYGHSTCRQTGALAAAAGVRRLWLTHYSAAVTDPAPGLAAARAAYPDAVAGTDGLRLVLDFDKEETL